MNTSNGVEEEEEESKRACEESLLGTRLFWVPGEESSEEDRRGRGDAINALFGYEKRRDEGQWTR